MHFTKFLNSYDITGYNPWSHKEATYMDKNELLLTQKNIPELMQYITFAIKNDDFKEFAYKNNKTIGKYKVSERDFRNKYVSWRGCNEMSCHKLPDNNTLMFDLQLYLDVSSTERSRCKFYIFQSYEYMIEKLRAKSMWIDLQCYESDDEQ